MKSIIASAMRNQKSYAISGEAVSGRVFPRAAAIIFKVERFMTRAVLLVLVYLCASNPLYAQGTEYITDVFEVTMRSGTSTSNSIVRMLRSGEAVTVLEEDPVSKYKLVETGDGKQGYVLSRFLMKQPAAKQRLPNSSKCLTGKQATTMPCSLPCRHQSRS